MLCVSSSGSCGGLGDDSAPEFLDKDGELTVLVAGPPGVGKTCICARILRRRVGDHKTPSDGKGQLCEVKEEVDGEAMLIRLRDVTTTFPIRSNASSPVDLRSEARNCGGVLVVYSVTDRGSLAMVRRLVAFVRNVRGRKDLPMVLVGNKMDLWTDRCVSREEGRAMAFDLGVSFYETSTRSHDQSVLRVFHDLVHQARCVRMRRDYERQRHQQEDSDVDSKRGTGFARGILGRLSFRSVKAKLTEMQILESNGLLDCNSQDPKE